MNTHFDLVLLQQPSLLCTNIEINLAIQVLDELPSSLLASVLAAVPKTLFNLLRPLPPHLHMDALHAVHPTISTQGFLNIIHRDTAAASDELLWALLPRVNHLKHLRLKFVSCTIEALPLERHLSQLSSLTQLWLESCQPTPRALTALLPAVGCLTGLQRLSVSGICLSPVKDANLVEQLHLAHLTNLKHLQLSRNCMTHQDFTPMTASLTALTALRELLLEHNFFSKPGMEALVSCFGALSRLQVLSFNDSQFQGRAVLAENLRQLSSLHSLLMGGSRNQHNSRRVPWMDIYALTACIPSFTGLHTLDLTGQRIDCKGISAFLHSLADPHPLRILQMEDNCLEDAGAAELAKHLPKLIHLEHLDVSMNDIMAQGMAALAPSIERLTSLKILKLNLNRLGAAGVAVMARHIAHLPSLQHLELQRVSHPLRHSCVADLGQFLPCMTRLSHLNLCHSAVSTLEDTRTVIASLQGLVCLRYLSISQNYLGLEAAELLAQSVTNLTRLSFLNLSGTSLKNEGMKALATSLCKIAGLQTLVLSFCSLEGTEVAEAVVPCFPILKCLRCLHLNLNSFGDEGAVLLSEHLHHLTALELLSLANNGILSAGCRAVASEALQLTSLTELVLSGNLCSSDVDLELPEFKHYEWIKFMQ